MLPDNNRMIQTFRDAGYRVASGYADGVITLEFPIDPTDTAIGVMHDREHVAESASIHRFFHPRSVAIIGASRRQDTIGQLLVRNLVTARLHRAGLRREPVGRARSAGCRRTSRVNEIPGDVDVAIVAVPAEAVTDVVLDCAAKGVHGLIVISSGFAETGEEGRQRQRHLVGLSRSYGLRLIGPNCLGVINTDPDVSVNASLSSVMPARGRAGFFCQSGALGSAILEKVKNRGLGISTFVSAGNRADVSGNDLLQYWEEDDATEVVMMYLESIGNPRKFSRIARRVSLRKPIVAVRSGRTTQGVPMGHTVRQISAPQAAVDAMFRQAGIIQVDTLEDMFDVAQLLAHQPLPRGRRVAIVGNSDALGLLAADAASAVGLVVNRSVALGCRRDRRGLRGRARRGDRRPRRRLRDRGLHPAAQRLAARRSPTCSPRWGSSPTSRWCPRSSAPRACPSCSGCPTSPARRPAGARCRRTPPSRPRCARSRSSSSTPCGCAPRTARRADPGEVQPAAARQFVQRLLVDRPEEVRARPGAGRRAARGLRHRPVAGRPGRLAQRRRNAAAKRLGWDVVLKATRESVRERPDPQHVWRNIDSTTEMKEAWGTLNGMVADPARPAFVVQKNAPAGVPVSIRSFEDPLFGPVVSFGISGPIVELLGDWAYRIPPLRRARRRRDGARGQELAAALRLPRRRAGRHRVDRAADHQGRPAPERPARGQRARAVARARRRGRRRPC